MRFTFDKMPLKGLNVNTQLFCYFQRKPLRHLTTEDVDFLCDLHRSWSFWEMYGQYQVANYTKAVHVRCNEKPITEHGKNERQLPLRLEQHHGTPL